MRMYASPRGLRREIAGSAAVVRMMIRLSMTPVRVQYRVSPTVIQSYSPLSANPITAPLGLNDTRAAGVNACA